MLREPTLVRGRAHNFRSKHQKTVFAQHDVCLLRQLGDIVLIPTQKAVIHLRMVTSFRRSLLKQSEKRLRFWHWFVFSSRAFITKKPKEIRMGKGKGNFFRWENLVDASKLFFSYSFSRRFFSCVNTFTLHQLMAKLGFRCWIQLRWPRMGSASWLINYSVK